MSAPRLLDLYCCAGGAGMGYHRAGFDVVGVDINPQPHYPFDFVQSDALEYLAAHWQEFDAVHASPPCQAFTRAGALSDDKAERGVHSRKTHLDLLTPTRAMLQLLPVPWIIENVPGAPMIDFITLCGSEFGLVAPDTDGVPIALRRHRQFESSHWLAGAGGCQHRSDMFTGSVFGHGGGDQLKFRGTKEGGGYVPSKAVSAALLGIDWRVSKRELSEAIPPAYTEHLGRQLIGMLERVQ
jgi:DNA (cytosine-5)-methyltransferase 1